MKTRPPGPFRARTRARTGVTESFRPRGAGPISTVRGNSSTSRPPGRPELSGSSWPNPRDAARLDSFLARASPPCVLCGAEPAARVIWIPTETAGRALGAPAGKQRIVAYGLCPACRAQPDAIDRAEAKMLEEAAQALASPSSN